MNAIAWFSTAAALCCFAANSILCRLALHGGHIDGTAFTGIRLASGAVVLSLLAARRDRSRSTWGGSFLLGFALFAYAAPFSYAYLRVGAAVGALVLFAAVQVTMIGWGVIRGDRPGLVAWFGIVFALLGLTGLTLPGQSAPDAFGTAIMAAAGIAWGVYSLRARASTGDPLVTTSRAFTCSLPFGAVLAGVFVPFTGVQASPRGVLLAVASGAVASGVGYSIWYAALRHLSATRAAVVQLVVPVLTAFAAVLMLGERASPRLLLASGAILGGVFLTIQDRASAVRSRR